MARGALLIAVPRLIGIIKVLFDDAECVCKALDALDNRQLRLIDALRNRLNIHSSITAWNMVLADSTCYTNPPNFEMSKAKICGTRGSSSTPRRRLGRLWRPFCRRRNQASLLHVLWWRHMKRRRLRRVSRHLACRSLGPLARARAHHYDDGSQERLYGRPGVCAAGVRCNVGRAATAVQVTFTDRAGAVGRSEEVSGITVDNVGLQATTRTAMMHVKTQPKAIGWRSASVEFAQFWYTTARGSRSRRSMRPERV